jgi:predicted RNA binding protein YcfA (HicA-like mRNA interferase family)
VKLLTGAAFARAVERNGWSLLRIRGSHHIYGKPGEVARLSIPVHGNQPLKVGLQQSLMKVAGLTDADLR